MDSCPHHVQCTPKTTKSPLILARNTGTLFTGEISAGLSVWLDLGTWTDKWTSGTSRQDNKLATANLVQHLTVSGRLMIGRWWQLLSLHVCELIIAIRYSPTRELCFLRPISTKLSSMEHSGLSHQTIKPKREGSVRTEKYKLNRRNKKRNSSHSSVAWISELSPWDRTNFNQKDQSLPQVSTLTTSSRRRKERESQNNLNNLALHD